MFLMRGGSNPRSLKRDLSNGPLLKAFKLVKIYVKICGVDPHQPPYLSENLGWLTPDNPLI